MAEHQETPDALTTQELRQQLVDELVEQGMSDSKSEGSQLENLKRSLAELNYSEKIEKLDSLEREILGAESPAELEKAFIDFKVQHAAMLELQGPILEQLSEIFSDPNVDSDEVLNALSRHYNQIKTSSIKMEGLLKRAEATHRTRKALFDLVDKTDSLEQFFDTVKKNEDFFIDLSEDLVKAEKPDKKDPFHRINQIRSEIMLAESGPNWVREMTGGKLDEYDWSRLPKFIADKLEPLIAEYFEKQKKEKAAEYEAMLDEVEDNRHLQKGLRKLLWFVPEGSKLDAESLSIEVEAFWERGDFSGPESEFAKLIPESLNFPPLNKKLLELLKKHPGRELAKIKRGEFNHDLRGLENALREVGNYYFPSESEGINATRLGLILNNLRAAWPGIVKVPRSVGGVLIGKRRMSKDEIIDRLAGGSLGFLKEDRNKFLLDAIVEALDYEGRARP